jgi:nicotinamide-nucleotide amidase
VLETEPLQRLLGRATVPNRRVLRFYGVSESAVARALTAAGGDGDGVDVTICARDFEIHVDLFAAAGAEARADELADALVAPNDRYLFSREEGSTAGFVLDLLRSRSLTLATAESCTGGLVAARLTDEPGSSDVFLGAIVAYSNAVKARQLGVSEELLAEHGAVSREAAAAMARGARERLGADVAVSVTGIAGPDGGTDDKPVGLVYVHAVAPWGEEALRIEGAADRESVRQRAAKSALHLVRRLLEQNRHSSV